MTRLEISPAVWQRFKSLAVERGISIPELLGSVVRGYVVRAEKRRRSIRVDS